MPRAEGSAVPRIAFICCGVVGGSGILRHLRCVNDGCLAGRRFIFRRRRRRPRFDDGRLLVAVLALLTILVPLLGPRHEIPSATRSVPVILTAIRLTAIRLATIWFTAIWFTAVRFAAVGFAAILAAAVISTAIASAIVIPAAIAILSVVAIVAWLLVVLTRGEGSAALLLIVDPGLRPIGEITAGAAVNRSAVTAA